MVSCVFGTKIYLKNGKVFNGQIRGKSDSPLFIYSPVSDSFFGVNIGDFRTQKIFNWLINTGEKNEYFYY